MLYLSEVCKTKKTYLILSTDIAEFVSKKYIISLTELDDIMIMLEKDKYIWVNVEGDSMSPLIDDGSKILIRMQESVDSGQIAVVLIDNEEAVVKKVEYGSDFVVLISINPYYPPRRFEGSDVLRVRVVGVVKEVSKQLQ